MREFETRILKSSSAEVCVIRDGGSIGYYRLEVDASPFDLFRPFDAASARDFDPLRAASFPMVPYFSRIRDGRFRFGGKTHQLRLNFGDHPHSVHGVGWQSVWTFEEAGESAVALFLDYRKGDWPYPFQARQVFTLEGADLCHELSIANAGDEEMPVGLGMHPFFPRHEGAVLCADVGAVWRYGEDFLPKELVACPPEWNLRTPKDVGRLNCDTVFEGWDRRAEIDWPARGVSLRIEADEGLDRLVVYAPPDGDVFCVEPVSQITDAFNMTADGMSVDATGMRTLAPGESWTVRAWFRPSLKERTGR